MALYTQVWGDVFYAPFGGYICASARSPSPLAVLCWILIRGGNRGGVARALHSQVEDPRLISGEGRVRRLYITCCDPAGPAARVEDQVIEITILVCTG